MNRLLRDVLSRWLGATHRAAPDRSTTYALRLAALLTALAATNISAQPAALSANATPRAGETGGGLTAHAEPARTSINPMTGLPDMSEDKRRRLVELKLDAQIESELLNIERSKIERRRLGAESGSRGGISGETASSSSKTAPDGGGKTTSVQRARSSAIRPPATAPVAATPTETSFAPRLVGLTQDGGRGAALVDIGGRVWTIEEGAAVAGVKVSRITVDGAVINGGLQSLQRGVGFIPAPASTPTVAPVSNATPAVNMPNRFTGLNLNAPATPSPSQAQPAMLDPFREPAVVR